MLQYPALDPIIFSVGPIAIRWYGMMYLLGFLAAYLLGRYRSKQPGSPLAAEQVEDLIFYGFDHFVADPVWLFRIWEGGMSFHGGLLGVLLALMLYARKVQRPLGAICDFVAPLAPLGLGFGRLANFINGELYGRPTDQPWAMLFPGDPLALARHPSQLYQFALEGLLLFAVVWWFSRQKRPAWSVTGVFLVGYGLARYTVEFFREPDAALIFDSLTRGQFLSMPMLVGGAVMIAFAFYSGGVDRSQSISAKGGVEAGSAKPRLSGKAKRKRRR